MNTYGNLGILSAILLITTILIGATAASVVMNGSEEITEEDYNEMVNGIVDELSTYLQIKDVIGYYEQIEGTNQIQKIAILIRPLVSTNIDTTLMNIEISNGEDVYLLSSTGNAAFVSTYSLFHHPLWDETAEGSYNLLISTDEDSSMLLYHTINKQTDTGFIIICLPSNLCMRNGDALHLTLIPAPGQQRTIILEAPLPMKPVVGLY